MTGDPTPSCKHRLSYLPFYADSQSCVGLSTFTPLGYRCERCGEYASLGPANDLGEHAAAVAVEIRAAELALESAEFVSHDAGSPWTWWADALGGAHLWHYWDHGEPQNPEQEAGFLAECIEQHDAAIASHDTHSEES